MKVVEVTPHFSKWFRGLRDHQARLRIQARIDRAEMGNYGDWKPVGNGVCEMRIHYGAGYRVYFIEHGKTTVVLLAGGVKARQSGDIQTAIALAENL
ncbi:MAG: type II toxin-antitoxin system RelE/ParE family toxin [Pseudomonadota bacterium]|nr:type II toxin-antitoxin system RelE/ParE family toxin [Pseudomonadota bacterium]MDE3038461.1 type II toxin-antitoxin system RelE/ParE family toxin [Pseudomonadota bacterium]